MSNISLVTASRATSQTLEDSLRKQLDSHSYQSYDSVTRFVSQSTRSQKTVDRVIILDDLSFFDDHYQELADYLYDNTSVEVVILTPSQGENGRQEFLYNLVNTSNSVCVPLPGPSVTISDLRRSVEQSITDLRNEYAPQVEATSVSVSTVDSLPGSDLLGSFNLASQGSQHSETGFMDSLDEGIYPELTVSSWGNVPTEFPGFEADDNTHPFIDMGTRVVICLSASPAHATAHAAVQAVNLTGPDGEHSVLYADFQSGEHHLIDIIDDQDAFDQFAPRSSEGAYYRDGNVWIATNGFISRTSDGDVRKIIDEGIQLFDYTVIDMTFDKVHLIPEIVEAYPSTSIVWLVPGDRNGPSHMFTQLLTPAVIPSKALTVFRDHMWPHPGFIDNEFAKRLEGILTKVCWPRDSFHDKLSALLSIPRV